MKFFDRYPWTTGVICGVLVGLSPILFLAACDSGQSGAPVVVDPHSGMTSYCLGDGSGMRVYERAFPTGGTQPLFSVVYTGGLWPTNPAYCRESQ